jgi:acetyl-CoA acetyltransferase
VPVTIPQKKGDPIIVDTDEHPRLDTTMDKLARLARRSAKRRGDGKPRFGINDGAAACC